MNYLQVVQVFSRTPPGSVLLVIQQIPHLPNALVRLANSPVGLPPMEDSLLLEDFLPLTLSFNLDDGNSVLIAATTVFDEKYIEVRLSLLDLASFIQVLLFLTGQHPRPGVLYDAWRHGSPLLQGALFVSRDNPDNSLLVRTGLISQGFLEMALEIEDREASVEVEDGQISELIKRLEAFEKKVSLFNSPYYNVPRHPRLEGNAVLH